MSKTNFAKEQLRSFVERIERLEEEKQSFTDDIKEVYGEAKGTGFDVKVLRMVVRIRKQDAIERQEQEAILDLYMHALGMLPEDDVAVSDSSQTVERHKAQKKTKAKPQRKTDETARDAVGFEVGEGA